MKKRQLAYNFVFIECIHDPHICKLSIRITLLTYIVSNHDIAKLVFQNTLIALCSERSSNGIKFQTPLAESCAAGIRRGKQLTHFQSDTFRHRELKSINTKTTKTGIKQVGFVQ